MHNPFVRCAITVVLAAFCLAPAGCDTSNAPETGSASSSPAPIHSFSPGIAGPGAGSADTRGQGEVAPGEGAGLTSAAGTVASPASVTVGSGR